MTDPSNNDGFSKGYRRIRLLRRGTNPLPPEEDSAFSEADSGTTDEENFDPSASLREHPLAQAMQTRTLKAPLLAYVLLIVSSLIYWRQLPQDFWSARQDWIFLDHEYWRCFSSLLVHADFVHLLSNSSLFLLFAWFLRHYFGWIAFPLLSSLGGALTMGLTVLSYEPQVPLGASGMVYFMNGLWLCYFLKHADYLKLGQRIARSMALLVVLVPTQFDPSVSYRSHAIGFALGLLIGAISCTRIKPLVPAQSVN